MLTHVGGQQTTGGRAGTWIFTLLAAVLFLIAADLRAEEQKPNFLVILAEAQGWSSLSSAMDDRVANSRSELNWTENLDRIANSGMRFSEAYSASPRCTPSRASLLTGKSPAQLHMTFVRGPGGGGDAARGLNKVIPPNCLYDLPTTELTIAKALKAEHYATAHFGKWHMGRTNPSAYGFDESDGPTANEGLANHPEETAKMADRGCDFMARQVKAGKPFYLQVSHYPARGATDVMAATMDAVKARLGGKLTAAGGRGGPGAADRRAADIAANQDMDESIGRLLKQIDALGIAGKTYVIFTSDHGSQGRNANAPLSAGKGTVWEGGIRVPFIVRGPGVAPGTYSHVRAVGVDLFPTITELAGIKEPLPNGVEGGSLVPVLTHAGSGEVKRRREELVFHFPHYDMDEYGPASAILLGDYKLIRFYANGSRVLYDVHNDTAERRDLANELPAKVKELDERLTTYLKEVGAQLPTTNPEFDAGKAGELLRGRMAD